ncbi:MAG: ASPIC/UnbV domain-containing protein, partial [Verrucomicrobiae bacterium]|nr:ASPIC/UnbV domain-containing protein [Verrucomicrobiae bacterium]
SAEDLRLHFGLGSASRLARVEVRWPGGEIQEWTDLPADHVLRLTEGDPEVAPLSFDLPARPAAEPTSR